MVFVFENTKKNVVNTVQWTKRFNTVDSRKSKRRKVKDKLRERTEIISWYYGPEGIR